MEEFYIRDTNKMDKIKEVVENSFDKTLNWYDIAKESIKAFNGEDELVCFPKETNIDDKLDAFGISVINDKLYVFAIAERVKEQDESFCKIYFGKVFVGKGVTDEGIGLSINTLHKISEWTIDELHDSELNFNRLSYPSNYYPEVTSLNEYIKEHKEEFEDLLNGKINYITTKYY